MMVDRRGPRMPGACEQSASLRAVNGRRHRRFYIDTFKTDRPSQRVIEKCGFGPPVALSLR
ncbi:hypothetical protein AYO44_11920 [Planctomycetaceae bacterium SCGC AG-212-F19]|nr:hypothetical protein AYO44_11920 [Planctomycetaceae bacterium SCGC AG-212-F19]